MITYYVDTASAAGGDGTTKATAGAHRAWSGLQEAYTSIHAVANYADDITISCVGAAADSVPVNISGEIFSVNGRTLYIVGDKLSSNGYHGGRLNISSYRLAANTGGNNAIVAPHLVLFPYSVVFDGIQFADAGAPTMVRFSDTLVLGAVKDCVMYFGASGYVDGIDCYQTAGRVEISNTVFASNGDGGGSIAVFVDCAGQNVACVNCSMLDVWKSFSVSHGNVTAENCAVESFTTPTGTVSASYIATVAGSGFGTNQIVVPSWASQYVDGAYAANANARLTAASVLLIAGIGPTADPSVPTADIVGLSRSGATTSVGVFEYYFPPDERHYYALKKIWPLKALDGDPVYEADTHIEGKYLDQAYDQGTALASELFPDTSTACLADWDRVCAVTPTGSVATQQAACASQMRARGGLSREYFIGIARAMGYSGCQILEGETLQFVVASESPPATQLPAKLFDPDEAYRWWMRIPAAQAPTGAPALLAKLQDLAPAWTLPGIGAPL